MSSFDVTFLGHQGWLFAAGQSRLLVDPLLTPAFGHKGALGVVYPPRVFSWDELPPIDAVFLSHEHEDHLDVPSLARINREVPILLSAHSSRAAYAFLREMGFAVQRVRPGDAVTIGDLELHLFAPDLSGAEMVDEWDVLPFFVRDRRGHGGFFTTIDVGSHERMEKSLAAIAQRSPVWCYTNNASDLSFATGGKVLRVGPLDTAALARELLDHYTGLRLRKTEPVATVMCGGGFAFAGDRAWMNERAFRADSAAVCASLSALLPDRTFHALVPGETLSQQHGKLVAIRPDSPFLRALPRAEWPSRRHAGPGPLLESYSPATAARDLEEAELVQLGAELEGFAAHLCSRRTFRALLSLDAHELEGRRPTFSLILLCDDEGGSYVYEYDGSSCAFVPTDGVDPVRDYVGGLECWASDLLAVFRGELAPSAVWFGRSRCWSALPERCPIDWGELWIYCHPLRRPDRFLELYRAMLASCADAPIVVRASSAGGPTIHA